MCLRLPANTFIYLYTIYFSVYSPANNLFYNFPTAPPPPLLQKIMVRPLKLNHADILYELIFCSRLLLQQEKALAKKVKPHAEAN